MSVYKKMFDKAEPSRSPSELAHEVTSARRTGKRPVKPFAAAAAGAAAAMALTVTVGAVSGWDMSRIARLWFGEEAEESIADKLTEIEVTSCEDTFDKLDFEFLGSVSDDIFTTIFIEITRTDGGVLDCAEYLMNGNTDGIPGERLRDKPFYSIPSSFLFTSSYEEDGRTISEDQEKHFRTFIVDDNDALDNKITAAFCVTADELRSYTGSGDKAELDFRINEVDRSINEVDGIVWTPMNEESVCVHSKYTDVFYGSLRARIVFPLLTGEVKTVKPDITVDMEVTPARAKSYKELINKNHPFTLKSFSITSSSLSYELIGEPVEGGDEHALYTWRELVKVNMKNGEQFTVNSLKPYVLSFSNNGKRNIPYDPAYDGVWYEKDAFMLGRLIDVNDVASVEIGGQIVTF